MGTGELSRSFCKHTDHPWTKYENVIATIPLSWSIYIVLKAIINVCGMYRFYLACGDGVPLAEVWWGAVNVPVGVVVEYSEAS